MKYLSQQSGSCLLGSACRCQKALKILLALSLIAPARAKQGLLVLIGTHLGQPCRALPHPAAQRIVPTQRTVPTLLFELRSNTQDPEAPPPRGADSPCRPRCPKQRTVGGRRWRLGWPGVSRVDRGAGAPGALKNSAPGWGIYKKSLYQNSLFPSINLGLGFRV